MWFRKKLIDDQTAATMHWLGQRGIVARPGLSPEKWAKAATDSTDYQSLIAASKKGPCAALQLCYTDTEGSLVDRVHDLADALELPIDEVTHDNGLRVRSGPRWDVYPITDSVLVDIAEDHVDHMHVILTAGKLIALAHRDVEDEAQALLNEYAKFHR